MLGLAIAVVMFYVLCLPIKFEIQYKRIKTDDSLIIKLLLIQNWSLFELTIPELYSSLFNTNGKILFFNMNSFDGTKPTEEYETEIKKPFQYINDIAAQISNLNYLQTNYKPLNKITKKLYKTIICQKISWTTELGFDDAAVTALAIGSLWNIKAWIYRHIKQNVILIDKEPLFIVCPKFGDNYFSTNLICIFSIRVGHIIITGIKFIVLMASFVLKGGDRAD